MKYNELDALNRKHKGKVCLFGAGLIGCTWAYDLLREVGFHIDFFCDNNKDENIEVNGGVRIASLETLYSVKSDVLVFITVNNKYQDDIKAQLEQNGILNIITVDFLFMQIFIESLIDMDDENLNRRFKFILDDTEYLKRQFKYKFGYELDIENPKTLNEKIQWLKINDRKPEYTQLADKYAVREFIKENFGEEFLIPLLFKTSNLNDLTYTNIPNEPCIIKTNHGSGDYQIIRSKGNIDMNKIIRNFTYSFRRNLYYYGREFQYKDIKPLIIIEKLLTLPNGKIPNDYKLHFFNGKCEFIYCSIDREGMNYRKVYDINWEPLEFVWTSHAKDLNSKQGLDIPEPKSLKKMVEIGEKIAKYIKYVRVDFYDVEGKLYCGEITLHHGSGYDKFYPSKYDLYYGQKLKLL